MPGQLLSGAVHMDIQGLGINAEPLRGRVKPNPSGLVIITFVDSTLQAFACEQEKARVVRSRPQLQGTGTALRIHSNATLHISVEHEPEPIQGVGIAVLKCNVCDGAGQILGKHDLEGASTHRDLRILDQTLL